MFALSQTPDINPWHAGLIFFILHLLVYPSSNGYNSYMDRDTESIGGIERPLLPTRQLFYLSIVMDITAVLLGFLVDLWFTAAVTAYILASRAYSYRGIRLKKYPFAGYLTVVLFQGAVTFFMVYHGNSESKTLRVPVEGMLASSLLIAGFYPLTQIYQHEADLKDGVRTISYLAGYRGTFLLAAVMYTGAMSMLGLYFFRRDEEKKFLILATIMLPIIVFFLKWLNKVWKDPKQADFRNTMQMNLLASICTNLAFLSLLIWRWL